jgi:hypothetical protein
MKKVLLTMALLCVASVCEAESGLIKLCRTPRGLDAMYLHKPLKVAAGLKFVDAGNVKFPNVKNNGRPVYIAISKDVVVADSNQCVTATAEVSQKPENYQILKGDGRFFRPNFIDNRADFSVTVVSDFK